MFVAVLLGTVICINLIKLQFTVLIQLISSNCCDNLCVYDLFLINAKRVYSQDCFCFISAMIFIRNYRTMPEQIPAMRFHKKFGLILRILVIFFKDHLARVLFSSTRDYRLVY